MLTRIPPEPAGRHSRRRRLHREFSTGPAALLRSRPINAQPVAATTCRPSGSRADAPRFPSGDPARWTHDPLSGAIVDGRVHGLGTVDMKCGTTASIFTYAYLSGLADELRGALTLTLVSDEETGGRWGSGYLVEHHADEVLGDCVLNGEPSSPHTIRFGEKAMFWMKFSIHAREGTARIHVSKSANRTRPRSSATSSRWNRSCPPPREWSARARGQQRSRGRERGWALGAGGVSRGDAQRRGSAAGSGQHAARLGRDRGGRPFARGGRPRRMSGARWSTSSSVPGSELEEGASQRVNATWSDPEHEMVGHLQDHVQALLGFRPPAIISLGGTDCRFWRAAGTPATGTDAPVRHGRAQRTVATTSFPQWSGRTRSPPDYLSRA